MKIAVTSSDGKIIDTHFGQTKIFHVYEIKNGKIIHFEEINTDTYCSENPMHTFRAEEFDKVYRIISDCTTLYTQKIGAAPAEKCKSLGMKICQAEGDILSAIKKNMVLD